MAVSTLYVLHAFIPAAGPTVYVITDHSLSAGLEEQITYAAGHPVPLFVSGRAQRPEITFSTPQINTVIGGCALNGINSGLTDLYWKKVSDLGTRVADVTLEHLRHRANQSYTYWTRVGATHQELASIDVRCMFGYDGTNAPLIPAGAVALAGTPAVSNLYTLGPVKLNGVFLPGITDWDLDLGVETFEVGSDGDPYTTFLGIKSHRPVVTIRSKESTSWTTYGAAGVPITACDLFLRRRTPDGHNYADAALQHIKLSATAGILLPQRSTARDNDEFDQEIRILLRAPNYATGVVSYAESVAIA